MRARVEAARKRQRVRYAKMPGDIWNGSVPGRWLDRSGKLETEARTLLVTAAERMGLSARAYHRVLRVSRTIADLDGAATIANGHVAEALQFRGV